MSAAVVVPPLVATTLQMALDWKGAELWFPERPALYQLSTTVIISNGTALDSDLTTIGFKQITISPDGQHLLLNGLRLNLRGTSIHPSQSYTHTWGKGGLIDTWDTRVREWKCLGVNVLRVHQAPAPERLLQGADEAGMMIIEESAVYARAYAFSTPVIESYIKNSRNWIEQWVRQRRNHPSVTLWSAENENGVAESHRSMSDQDIQLLASTVHAADPSRPVSCDGDQIGSTTHVPEAPNYTVTNYHYPEGYGNSWSRKEKSIYMPPLTVGRPNAVGEFVTDYNNKGGADNKLWHGLVVRGLRYTNWADIRPYTLAWAMASPSSELYIEAEAKAKDFDWAEAVERLRNGLAAVALFDYAYDDLGPAPLFQVWPALALTGSSDEATLRKFVLYNDEFVGSMSVTAQFTLTSNRTGTQLGGTSLTVRVPVGEHVDIFCQFSQQTFGKSDGVHNAAATDEELADLTLSTSKAGVRKFSEVRRFRLQSVGYSLAGSSVRIACATAAVIV